MTGTVTNLATGVVTDATGTLTITRFANNGGALVALGTLSLPDVPGFPPQAVTVPVNASDPPSCQILHLDLGPLSLNLLGLQINLDEVVLNITAQQGPGNLLGNLLCAVTNLLNNGVSLNAIAALLNQILGALNL